MQPTVKAPTILCPIAPLPIVSANGQSAPVSYGAASISNGTPPVVVTCTPPSGSSFAVGSSTVACTAIDAVHRAATCSFAVTVTLPPPRLSVTTILAFGDSITEGEVPTFGEFSIRSRFVEPDRAYPADLTTLIAQRYVAQGAVRLDAFCTNDPPAPITGGILVVNAGCLGERAQDTATLARLDDKLAAYHPDLVLVMEGVNDLNAKAGSVPLAVAGVQRLIAEAGRRAAVLSGTLLPEIADKVNAGAAPFVVPFNSQLMATIPGVIDLYGDVSLDVVDWISPYDGLHPTEAGYEELARVWFNTIKQTFEVPTPGALTPTAQKAAGRPGPSMTRLKR
jgi:lysophospholipase L1-like esterase